MLKIRSIIIIFGLVVLGSNLVAGTGMSKYVEKGAKVPTSEKVITIAAVAATGAAIVIATKYAWSKQNSQNKNTTNHAEKVEDSHGSDSHSDHENSHVSDSDSDDIDSGHDKLFAAQQCAKSRKHPRVETAGVTHFGPNRFVNPHVNSSVTGITSTHEEE